MPAQAGQTGADAGDSASDELDVPALLARLEEEVRLLGARHGSAGGASAERVNARATADRLWPVSADRHLGGRGGAVGAAIKPVKLLVRAVARPQVEPAFAEQRAFNDAALRLVDELQRRVDALRAATREP
ncbi:MAG TPA: hypothetical protein VM290_00010 [Gaiellaceae bacterium]|nr:hypothetical protein [Gaiellaceae bacterium]